MGISIQQQKEDCEYQGWPRELIRQGDRRVVAKDVPYLLIAGKASQEMEVEVRD
jgi:hypothetical protein